MPPPAVYVIAIVGGVAAAVAFKEFVYDPHIAPQFVRWQAQFEASRARRRQRRGEAASAVATESRTGGSGEDHSTSGTELRSLHSRPRQNSGSDDGLDELEQIIAREVNEWRSGVEVNQTDVRNRRSNPSGSALEESNTFLPYTPISPTHIVFDFTAETISPTDSQRSGSRTAAIRVAGPPSTVEPGSPEMSSVLRPSDSVSASGQETPQMSPQVQPPSLSFTYDAHNLSLSPPVVVSPNLPSSPLFSATSSSSGLIVRPSHPQALGLDLFPTPPISRPETPFSSISSISGAPESPYEIPSPRLAHLTLPSSHSPVYDMSADHAEFLSAISQSETTSRTISEADFMSAVGDGEDEFDVMSGSAGSSPVGDGFDIGDDPSEAGSWTSVPQPRR